MEHLDNTPSAQIQVGIDMSKQTLDACLLPSGKKPVYGKFTNDRKGFQQFLRWARRFADGATIHFCMEATGAYGEACAMFLADQKQLISVVNPHSIHHWSLAKGQGNKTDKADAYAIADYCLKEKPRLWRMAAPEVRELTALVRHLDNLVQTTIQQKNRLTEPNLPTTVTASLKKMLAQVEAEATAVEKLIKEHINKHCSLKRDRDLLLSIPGIGEATAAKILAELPDVDQFASAKVAAKYAGLSPSQFQSGTSVRKRTRLYVAGKRRLKAALYMPAMSAIRYNEPIKRLYKRLIDKGHKGASAVAAAMRKLLMIAFGVLKSRRPFTNDFAHLSNA